ncbi:defective proboscis extension response [Culex quinquefasciatus]|uniref:Defective proboscis extension response n=1 Tax=Culex quinquefasciatus TaxID=7176 RepID=B0X6L5_CULQU|nr:defective proboscis extension response [Culex quinquefasciatus]|eukprot:XP_001865287.1 defective proboscis extension response [Culex quinquefasciatus]
MKWFRIEIDSVNGSQREASKQQQQQQQSQSQSQSQQQQSFQQTTAKDASGQVNMLASSSSSSGRGGVEPTDAARTGPYFDLSASKNVTALLGKTAYLNCRVKNLGNKTQTMADKDSLKMFPHVRF